VVASTISGALDQRAQPFHVLHDDLARIHLEQAFGLQAHKVAADELAHGAELAASSW